MKISAIDFPSELLNALREDKLVVFAGAGVSMGEPARLPNFRELAKAVAQDTGQVLQDGVPEDNFLGRLENEGANVHARAAEVLSRGNVEPTDLHRHLLRLYSNPASVRIVTTNFDPLFEQAAEHEFESRPNVFKAPALPLGRKFNGIVHVHGAIDRPREMVLTDRDFGRAYLTDGWARRFLVELFRSFTVLFVGYSHSDIVMTYLARALPIGEVIRFALTREDEDIDRWRLLGIEPVVYRKSCGDNHQALGRGIGGLANFARSGVLDWRREIREIAEKPPSLEEESMDLVEDALSDPTKTRFFTDAASDVEWIDWLDKRKHLESLFGNGAFGERDMRLARWLADKFVCDDSDELFLLIARHGMRMRRSFWSALARAVASKQGLDTGILSRWVAVLIDTAPRFDNQHALHRLGRRCIEAGMTNSVLDIFHAMSTIHLVAQPGFLDTRVTGELGLLSDHYTINDIWEKGLKPALVEVAEQLLAEVVQNLTKQHRTLRAWQSADRSSDPTSYGRSAIEPHDQDKYREPTDVLIDAARDCLEHLATKQPTVAASWCDRLIEADAPLLRRLAVHALPMRNDLSPDEKVDWLFATIGLHDFSAHHETFRALRTIYPAASAAQREAVIEAVFDYAWPRQEDKDKGRHAAYQHFHWLYWLSESAPNCEVAKQALNEVWKANPSFEPWEHPDLTHYVTAGSAVPGRGWNADELLSRPARGWIADPSSFLEEDPAALDRYDLLRAVEEAATENFQWGLELADALAESGNWDTDLWRFLMTAWSRELGELKHREVLDRLSIIELYPKHARSVADCLRALVKQGGLPYAPNLLDEANQIATAVWDSLDRTEPLYETDNWLDKAVNHPAGSITDFWLESLSLWGKQQDPRPDTLGDEYQTALGSIVQDDTLIGRLGRTVLARQLAFIFAVDHEWAAARLVPLLKRPDDPDYQAVWNGYLHGGHLNPHLADALRSAFLDAVSRMNSTFPNQEWPRQQFVRLYAIMAIFFVEAPLDSWIPKFFETAEPDDRAQFAWQIGHTLDDMDDAKQREWWHRWLRRYWENRLQGVPALLAADEIHAMLDWLPYLRGVYPDAVDVAIRMEPVSLENTLVIHQINQSELWQEHPQATAKLVIHLGRSELSSWAWEDGKALIEKVLQTDLPENLKTKLGELIAELGLD